jgi:hypothetical protein
MQRPEIRLIGPRIAWPQLRVKRPALENQEVENPQALEWAGRRKLGDDGCLGLASLCTHWKRLVVKA